MLVLKVSVETGFCGRNFFGELLKRETLEAYFVNEIYACWQNLATQFCALGIAQKQFLTDFDLYLHKGVNKKANLSV